MRVEEIAMFFLSTARPSENGRYLTSLCLSNPLPLPSPRVPSLLSDFVFFLYSRRRRRRTIFDVRVPGCRYITARLRETVSLLAYESLIENLTTFRGVLSAGV